MPKSALSSLKIDRWFEEKSKDPTSKYYAGNAYKETDDQGNVVNANDATEMMKGMSMMWWRENCGDTAYKMPGMGNKRNHFEVAG